MIDSERYTNSQLLDFFQSRLSGMSSESKMRYRKTLRELDLFLTGHNLCLADISESMMADWCVELSYRGLAQSTITRHLNCLSSMAKAAFEAGLLKSCNAPRALAETLTANTAVQPPLMSGAVLDACIAVVRRASKRDTGSGNDVFTDLFLFSLLNGAPELGTIARLKRDDTDGYSEASRAILSRNAENRRRYIFDLRQTLLTARQLKADITAGVQAAFSHAIAIPGLDPDELARSIWAACAMKCGLTASEALAYAGGSASYAVPEYCTPASVLAEGKKAWIEAVESLILGGKPEWYAMHIRKGVAFDELRKEICEKIRPCPDLFYPCETITKLRGGKKIEEEQPFIDRTAFFRSHQKNVLPMFAVIGDKAWCYRVSASPGSPYARIPQHDMARFQRAIGVFTPDVEIHPLGGLVPKPGESVIMVMNGFSDRVGIVERVINKECGSAIFQVRLDTDMGYEFRICVDARQIERILG